MMQGRLAAMRNASNLEFQRVEICCPVEVIDLLDSFEPQGYFQRYGQQEKLYTDFCKACNDNAFC
jgi:hypothetical protein